MLVAVIPLIFVVIGLLIYLLTSNPRISELGRIMFATSFLALMLSVASKTFRIG